MPWHKVQNHAECPAGKPWAVVKDSDGSVAGCHASESDADAQMAALYANESAEGNTEDLGGKPNPGTKKDKRLHENNHDSKNDGKKGDQYAGAPPGDCPPGQKPGPDGKCMPMEKMADDTEALADAPAAAPVQTSAPWSGVLCVEGITTGDGREFSPESLTWGDLPIPLRWNKEDSHGGVPSTVTVNVGNITELSRDGNEIRGKGNIDLTTEDGRTVYGKIKGEYLRGVSIDADSISDADMEFVFPDGDGEEKTAEEELLDMLFLMPEKVIFHAGRIRAATLCDIPAFAEAYIQLDGEALSDATMTALAAAAMVAETFGAVSPHSTDTSDSAWNGPANEKRLPSPMTASIARAAYAWTDGTGGELSKADCKFIHHEISADGTVGPANLTACSTGIGVLNGGRGGTVIPAGDKRGVYNHLAKHLRDAGQEPPPANFESGNVVAAGLLDDRPPADWFNDPKLSLLTPITVTDEGRVYGHAAEWGECHVGIADACVTPPFEDFHPYFMTGEVACNDGTRVAVGQITLGTGHASLNLGATPAAEHYDNTGTAVADVAVGNDEHGIWVAGSVRPGTDIHRVRELRASGQVSGDWRRIGGQLRLVGLLAVNVPGYPVPKIQTRVASGAQLALVAAGRPSIRGGYSDDELEKIAMRAMANKLAARIGRSTREVQTNVRVS